MTKQSAKKLFNINSKLVKPKHRQIIDEVLDAITEGRLKRKDIMPTISDVCETQKLSRLTVLKAYEELQQLGIIKAEKRKGYHVVSEDIKKKNNIFLLFDEFTMYKKTLYNAFREKIGSNGFIDIYFHHYNLKLFESLIINNIGSYTSYVVMPWPNQTVPSIINKMDPGLTLLLDRKDALFKTKKFNYIVQDHKEEMVLCLEASRVDIKKYSKFILVHPSYSFHPTTTIDGFREFCKKHRIKHDVFTTLRNTDIRPNTAYFVVDDNELVIIVDYCMNSGYKLGKDIGIISYNETPMKRIIANGITVISTDFAMMGEHAADYVLNPSASVHKVIPTSLIKRGSL